MEKPKLPNMYKLILITIITALFSFPLVAQIDVMSYNVRYATENDGENSWSKRKDYITTQIKYYEPDVMGVQEAVLEQLEYFQQNLNGYEYIGAGRDDGKTKGEFSAIFYDTEKLKVSKDNTFWLSETPEKVSVGWDAAMERVCTYGLFEVKDSGQRFWVFNSHFDHIGEKARAESAKLILAKIEEINTENLPVIFMGDLNLEPDTEAIKSISDKMNDSKLNAVIDFGPEGTYNGFKFCEPISRRIDYIFTSKGNLEIFKYAVITDSKDLKYPSDHFPVMVNLQFQ